MIVAVRIRTDALYKFGVDGLGTDRLLRESFGEGIADVVRHAPPGGTVAERSQVIDSVVEHAAGEGTKFFPVVRVEGFINS